MRHIHKAIVLISSLYLHTATFAGAPFYPQSVEAFQPDHPPSKGQTHLRISVSNGDGRFENQVSMGSISVCSKSACYRPTTKTSVDLYDTSQGKSEAIAEMIVPYTEINSIHFDSVAGLKSIAGDIKLTTPLKLEEGFEGAEVLVVMNKVPGKQGVTFSPSMTATGLLRSHGSSVYYNPKTATLASLKLGTTLSIPAGATSSPQVFNVAVHDTGDAFPLVDIYPVMKLAQPASITFSEIARAASKDTAASQVSPASSSSSKESKSLFETGVIRPANKKTSSIDPAISTNVTALAAPTDPCVAALQASWNQQAITSALAKTGTVNVSLCEQTSPFVHIAISDIMDTRELLRLAYNPPVDSRRSLPLMRIGTWAPGTQVLLNGFTWNGDYGITDGGIGRALGFLENSPDVLGTNRIGGGVSATASVDSNKFGLLIQAASFPDWREGQNPPLWVGAGVPGPWTIISSSTSIMKYTVCGSDATVNRWSAVGTGVVPYRMIFISSTSESTTSAAELCAVFKALGANNAIRLDGGPSTAITIDGVLKNPLTGLDSFKYGISRHIAYALKVGYPGAGATPVISNTVSVPTNPCIRNPKSCN